MPPTLESLPAELQYQIITELLLLYMPDGVVDLFGKPLVSIFRVSPLIRYMAIEIMLKNFTFVVSDGFFDRDLMKWHRDYDDSESFFNHCFFGKTVRESIRSLAVDDRLFGYSVRYRMSVIRIIRFLPSLKNLTHFACRVRGNKFQELNVASEKTLSSPSLIDTLLQLPNLKAIWITDRDFQIVRPKGVIMHPSLNVRAWLIKQFECKTKKEGLVRAPEIRMAGWTSSGWYELVPSGEGVVTGQELEEPREGTVVSFGYIGQ